MHDIDRTQLEMYETPLQRLQPEQFEFSAEGEYEGEYEGEEEYAGEAEYQGEDEWSGEFQEGELPAETLGAETFEGESYESAPEMQEAYESPLGEAEQMELATELLEITNEAELDQFLGKLIRRAGRAVGRVVRSPLGRAVGGMLKPLARAALPIAGRAVGTFLGGPVGGMVGGQLASTAGRLFGLELEGLSQEDREYEVARRFVRFASTAARQAVSAPPAAPPMAVARRAIAIAARRHAPGVALTPGAGPRPVPYPDAAVAGGRNRGMWIRRGRRIILLGL